MSTIVRGSVAEQETALEYMTAIGLKFKENEKAEIHLLLDKLIKTKYEASGSVREHIMSIIQTTTRLRDLNVAFPDAFIIHICFENLPASFVPLRTAYFAQKEQWDLNELIAICVQEEELLKRDKSISVNLVNKPNWKGKNKASGSNTIVASEGTNGTKAVKLGPKKFGGKGKKSGNFKCFFCKKEGHIKKNC
ncbi:putative transcription factor interactor and regulator CCHC(Zn) family [Rosa chinensis]|uniref:Putative transcription factor interactor and regulator CCHC(Zn) family n=1 Tax=Rosa chinensis TaxID=74649 RepID=A0A2P6PK22_ROSCH|nr:putative transcription factor interactor and regulator CCHC(Zn) family [Rosa chinensis]